MTWQLLELLPPYAKDKLGLRLQSTLMLYDRDFFIFSRLSLSRF